MSTLVNFLNSWPRSSDQKHNTWKNCDAQSPKKWNVEGKKKHYIKRFEIKNSNQKNES
jgi:hypothetical protein